MRGLTVMVDSGSSEHFCVHCEPKFCPICGSQLVELGYLGKDANFLGLMKEKGFRSFLGCLRVDLHDKVFDGVDYRGKVYLFRALFSVPARR